MYIGVLLGAKNLLNISVISNELPFPMDVSTDGVMDYV